MGRYELAVGYSLIFWPQFVAFEGYVLRSNFSIDSLRGFEKQTNHERQAVEAVMNHLHIADIHGSDEDMNEGHLRHLGNVLRDIYTTKLSVDFPDRRFEVAFNDIPGLDYLDYELTFWQIV